MRLPRTAAFALGAALALGIALPLPATELFGRPLRGLTAVPPGEVAKNPGRYAGRSVRVEGTIRRGGDGAFSLSEGGGTLRLRAEGFSLPPSVDGAPAAAEGRIAADGETAELVASGVEVRR